MHNSTQAPAAALSEEWIEDSRCQQLQMTALIVWYTL